MICPTCTADNREGVAFCEECGERLLIESPCGHSNRLGIAFCEDCGEPIEAATVVEPVVIEEVASPSPSPEQSEFVPCGHRNRPGVTFCETCGAALEASKAGRRFRAWQAAAAAVIVVGGAAAGLVLLKSSGPPSPEELVARLPEPASVVDCDSLAAAASDFIHAAAAVAVDEPSLTSDVSTFGSGYSLRLDSLGCTDGEILDDVQTVSRPGEGATATEIVEFFLTGVNVTYPDVPVEFVSTGGSP